VRQIYRVFADNECRGYSNLYFTLAHAVAEHEELISFLAPLAII
jgi:hypothetical protein